jgi:hypothetical protein
MPCITKDVGYQRYGDRESQEHPLLDPRRDPNGDLGRNRDYWASLAHPFKGSRRLRR